MNIDRLLGALAFCDVPNRRSVSAIFQPFKGSQIVERLEIYLFVGHQGRGRIGELRELNRLPVTQREHMHEVAFHRAICGFHSTFEMAKHHDFVPLSDVLTRVEELYFFQFWQSLKEVSDLFLASPNSTEGRNRRRPWN